MKPVLTLQKLLAIACLTLAIPLALQAQPLMEDHCEKRPIPPTDSEFTPGIPPYLRGVKLTEAQEDKIFALIHDQIPALREQGKQRHKVIGELRALTNAEKFDEAKAQQLADKLAAIEKEAVLTRARNDYKIFSLLTPEQRQQAQDAKSQKNWHRHGDHGEHADFKMPGKPAPYFVKS
jgi:protein CpxP